MPAAWGTGGALDNLKVLNLTNNTFSGTLPAQWGGLTNGAVFDDLEVLDMSSNGLTGYLPTEWGQGFTVSAGSLSSKKSSM